MWNNEYTYDNVKLIKLDLPVQATCPKHGDFTTLPYDHIRATRRATGCPNCQGSKAELEIIDFLTENRVEFKKEYTIDGFGYRFDFFIPDLNLIVEYHGKQHFQEVKFFNKNVSFKRFVEIDKEKTILANKLGYKFFVIPYNLKTIEQLIIALNTYTKFKYGNKLYRNKGDLINDNPKDVNDNNYTEFRYSFKEE